MKLQNTELLVTLFTREYMTRSIVFLDCQEEFSMKNIREYSRVIAAWSGGVSCIES